MNPRLLTALVLLALSGCVSTSEPGWQGAGATPFDTARQDCQAQVVRQMTAVAKDAAFDLCMANRGWRRR